VRIAKPFVLTFIGLRASGHTIFAALAQAVRHHLHIGKP
jgi:hypothetical protein